MISVIDREGNYVYVAPSHESILGYDAEELIGKSAFKLVHPDDRDRIEKNFQDLGKRKKIITEPFRMRVKGGEYEWMQTTGTNLLTDPSVGGFVINTTKVTESHYYNRLDALERKILKKSVAGDSFTEILEVYAKGIEEIHTGILCSILKVENGRLYTLAAPSLPPDYIKLIEGFEAGENQGACGTAVHTGEKVIIEDAENDVRTQKFPELIKNNLKALWSQPVKNEHGEVIATFTMYYDHPQLPGEQETKTLERATHLLQLLFKNQNTLRELQESNERFRYINQVTEEVIYEHNFEKNEITLSKNFETIFGYSYEGDEFTLDLWKKNLHPDDRDEINRRLDKTLKDINANKWEAEFRFAREDGTFVYVSENSYIIRNKRGEVERMIGTIRDVTDRKFREIKKEIISNISHIFNEAPDLKKSLNRSLPELMLIDDFKLAEVWLINPDDKSLDLAASFDEEAGLFYKAEGDISSFELGKGLPGVTLKTGNAQIWNNLEEHPSFLRKNGAKINRLKTGLSFPIIDTDECTLGVLLLALEDGRAGYKTYISLLQELADHLGEEIHRKRTEVELDRIFSFAPDVICVAGLDGYFKKVNPAMSRMLGYSEEELLSRPITSLVHPEDKVKMAREIEALHEDIGNSKFENRVLTKMGEVLWLSWTSQSFYDEGKVYSVARDITEQKKLQDLLQRANQLAKIGSWEVDLVNDEVFWSDITREIHELDSDFEMDLESRINFYKEGESREKIREALNRAIQHGEPWDLELELVTAKGNERWVRAIGEVEFVNGEASRIYGSFQDIHDRKSVEERLKNTTNNLPGIIFQYSLDPEGNDSVKNLSEGAVEIWGLSAEQTMEDFDKVWAMCHQADIEQVQKSILKSASSLTQWHHVWRYHHPDDSLRWQEGYGTPKQLADGTVVWDSIIFDITEKKELEELLEQTAKLAKVGSWELDLRKSDNQMYWSNMTREILEVDKNTTASLQGMLDFYKPESRKRAEKAVEKTLNKGKSFDLELFITTAKGRDKWIRSIGQAEFEDGEPVRIYGSYQDIHLRKVAEIELEDRNRHINAIASLNAALLNYAEWFEALENHLEMIGRVIRSDRVYYFENRFDPDTGEGYTSQKLKWCRKGITPRMNNQDTEEMPFSEIPELIGPMKKGRPTMVSISGVDEETVVRKIMEDQQIKTFLVIPVMVQNHFHGFIGFDNCRAEAEWSDEEIRTLKTITSNLGIAIERKGAEREILKKTEQLDAIALFNGLIIQYDHWLDALEESMEHFGHLVNADRVYFFEASDPSPKEGEISIKTEWTREGVQPQIDSEDQYNIPFQEIWEFMEPLLKNEPYNSMVRTIQDPGFRRFLEEQNIKSVLALPVFADGRFRGFFGFDDCRHERNWNDKEISFLQTISLNLASAIENTDAKRAIEKAFEEKNNILESIGDAFFAVDEEFTVTYWNRMAEEVLGMQRDEIVGEHLWDFYEDATEMEFFRQYNKALREQCVVSFEEYYPPLEKWFEVSAYPSKEGLSVFFKDVTERKRSEERLKELNRSLEQQAKELAASNAELEQFAFVASHDLQEPLRMITGFLTQLEKKYNDVLDEKGKKYIYFATDGAKRMRQIILDLLDFSRIGRVDSEPVRIDLNILMNDVLSLNRKLVKETKADIIVSKLPEISASRSSMQQLFQNLITNAIKYQEPGSTPRVKISAEEDENKWTFSVEDNGIGINPEYFDRIFNIFQRLHGRDTYSGTGMGLAISKKIVEEHGGDIWVISQEGQGSTFYFTIPKKPQL